jgi:hypothetical protein
MRGSTATFAILLTTILVGPAAPQAVYGSAALSHAGPVVQDTTGEALYGLGCASCHGADGRGVAAERRAFEVEVPDFTECSFSSREPDADWLAVVHAGGPVRAFDQTMPAFGEAFTEAQILAVLTHVRTFCGDDSWPRGELNLPRSLFTEKAYPEDEAVTTVTVNAEGPGGVVNELVYEKRFGARNQIEIKIPFGARERTSGGDSWGAGFGDVALGFKRALVHSVVSGSIVSAGGELILPTGDESLGLGSGVWKVEPFILYGQVLPADAFLHAQLLAETPLDGAGASEGALRFVLGKTWTQGRFGRAWSPMIEVLTRREFESDAAIAWDLVPQFQVTLNTRQHIMANLGVRIPVTDADVRQTQVLFYLLWDWFDGGFFDGW